VITEFEYYYPELTYSITLVNLPRTFEALLGLMKPIMRESTRNAMRTFGYDKEEWRRELLKEIADDQLMPALGGSSN
jgi:hypothetical protein